MAANKIQFISVSQRSSLDYTNAFSTFTYVESSFWWQRHRHKLFTNTLDQLLLNSPCMTNQYSGRSPSEQTLSCALGTTHPQIYILLRVRIEHLKNCFPSKKRTKVNWIFYLNISLIWKLGKKVFVGCNKIVIIEIRIMSPYFIQILKNSWALRWGK